MVMRAFALTSSHIVLQVFMRVGHGMDDDRKPQAVSEAAAGSPSPGSHDFRGQIGAEDVSTGAHGYSVYHVRALFLKRMQNAKRDKKAMFWQLVMPALLLLPPAACS